jgi:hypothetical protein
VRRDLGLGVCLLGWLATTAGCSIIAVTGPTPSQRPRVDVACTVDGYAPAIDRYLAAGLILGGLSGDDRLPDSKAAVVLTGGAYLASGLYGLHTIGKCAKAKNAAYAYHATLLRTESESGEPVPPTPPAAPFRPRTPENGADEPSVRMAPPSAPQPQQHEDEQ